MKISVFKSIKLHFVNLIAIAFLLPLLGGAGGGLYAQDPELFNHTWYLHKIVLDDGTEHIPVPNNDVPFIELIFFDDTPYQFETAVCNIFFGTLEFDSNQSFTIQDTAMTLIECLPEENFTFEGKQFGFFLDSNNNHLEDPFPYNITTNGSEKTLTITNTRGDLAIYGNKILSVGSFERIAFSIYPNPVKDFLTIQNQNAYLCKVTTLVFDINGKLIISETIDEGNSNISLNVGHLKNGVYFLKIKNSYGEEQLSKFIKH